MAARKLLSDKGMNLRMKRSRLDDISWQEFEELIREILERNDFKTDFRVVFKDEHGRAEMDVIGEKFGILIGIDAKRYNRGWYRKSALKRQAEKHCERCSRFARLTGKRIIPVIVSLIDDEIILHKDCLIVPFKALNDFLVNIEYYLEEMGITGI